MEKQKRFTNALLIILGIVFIISMTLIVFLNKNIQTENFWSNQQDKLLLVTQNCADEINNWALMQSAIVKNLSEELSGGLFEAAKNYEKLLTLTVNQNADVQAAYITLEDGQEIFQEGFIPPDSDYEAFFEWYRICMEAGGEIIFTEPYLDPLTGGIVISCMKAITMPDKTRGIVGIDIALNSLVARVDSLQPSPNGGAYLVSPQGKVITYYIDPAFLPRIIGADNGPDEAELGTKLANAEQTPKYITESGLAFLNAGWVIAQVDVLKTVDTHSAANDLIVMLINDYDGVEKYEAMVTIPATGWTLGVNIPLPDYDAEVQQVIKNQTPIILLAVLMSIISIIVALILIDNIRRQEHLQKNIEIAQAASRTKSDFLSRMSHEIRTPMNAIIGMARIADNTNDTNKLRYCLSTIEASSEHLLGIINDILDMSKIEAGKLELYEAPMNVEKILMKICNLIIDKTEQKDQTLDIILGKDMGMNYIGDELRLSQVITNIMSNAVKFTPNNGKITLAVDEIQRDENISTLRFSITDTGIGMSEEQLERLFNSFEQADTSISRRFGGTGLGLVISKSIVEKMGGHIKVDSAPGKGSTFMFEVKVKPAPRQDHTVIFNNIRPADLKLLVVDDDAEIREHFKSITENFGIYTEEAEDGRKAIYMAGEAQETQQPYDVIFIDYDMPGMDGIETVRKLSTKIDKNTAIIMTSFLTWNKIEEEASSVGIQRFITKPLFPSSILDAINEVVGNVAKNLQMKTGHTKETPDFSGRTLLLAEDIDINREIFIALLESTNISIVTAENGAQAVQKFSENENIYDLIVMDVQMPEMDGHEATRRIRALGSKKATTIPIIAMTANAFKEDVEQCLASGMNNHLPKPIDEKLLIETISHYLPVWTEEKEREYSWTGIDRRR